MHVVCTAGHVDHGKSTLVRALTGMEPDRLEEERRRGLTIELGYAWTRMVVDGRESDVAFVDLPGHERFVATMLAGAGAVRRALLVVAADEGWMPQSAEHLAILDLLEVQAGVVVLSRCDLVDAETADVAEELLREELAGSTLAEAPVVRVGLPPNGPATGLDAVRDALTEMLAAAPPASSRGRPRLWVDRSFTVSGAGTVVTGTLSGGALAEGDEVVFEPTGTATRIRGLQQLAEPVQRAEGGRVAVNVAGVARGEVGRGDALVVGDWRSTDVADAWVRAVADRPIRRRGAWHVHVGSAERLVRIEPWTGDVDAPGGFVRLRIDPPLPIVAGDRIVLREAGARVTVGGGVVLDAAPPPRRRGRGARERRVAELQRRSDALTEGDARALVAAVVAESGACRPSDLAAGLDLADPALAARGAGLADLGGWWADPRALEVWASALRSALATVHSDAPLEVGALRTVVDAALIRSGCPGDALDPVLDWLVASGVVVAEGPRYRLPEHRVVLTGGDAAARDRLLAVLDEAPFNPPNLADAASAAGASAALLRALHADGTLVRLTERLSWTSAAVEAAVDRLRAAADAGPLTASQAKEALESSRKHVVPLLEELDRRGITRRVGDRREVR